MNKLYIVSSGSGGSSYITPEAREALTECEIVVSYSKYARELKEFIVGKELFTSGMTHELERCAQAIEYARSGKTTCIISNGDANVYGMASIVVELMNEQNLWNDVELITLPGVTSFLATAAKVGAPISQDFSVISLSDRLNDVNLIDKRINMSLECDFVIGIYNPKSKKRILPYENFLKSLERVDERIVVIAQHVGRETKEKITISTTTDLIQQGIDNPELGMSTLIIVCNTSTRLTKNGKILTPRKYISKYDMDRQIK